MDNNYSLISERDLVSEKFNSMIFETKQVRHFMILYMQMLEFAQEINVIDQAEKLRIADIILSYITEETESEVLPISNSLYVMALWLDSMSNWEAWERISRISDARTAKVFVDDYTFWFYDRIKEMLEKLASVKAKVESLKVTNILMTFKAIKQSLSDLRTFKLAGTELNLKSMHSEFVLSDYSFLADNIISAKKNYFEKLKTTVDAFVSEVNILAKLDMKSFMQFRDEENINILKQREEHLLQINRSELENLKQQYHKDFELAMEEQKDLDDKIEKLSQEFAMQHPELKGEKLESAFENFYDSLPEDFFYIVSDVNEIRNEYERKRDNILAEISAQEKELEAKEQDAIKMRGEIDLEFSLSYLVKEYALIFLVNKGAFEYPETPEKRGVILDMITNQMAVTEFLNNIELEESDINYLKATL